jgi:hypothetical protein
MANVDRPTGFRPLRAITHGAAPVSRPVASGQSWSKGDPLRLVSGELVAAGATNKRIYAVAGAAVDAGSPPTCPVWLAGDWLFRAQCSGTYVPSTMDYTEMDIEGVAGTTPFEVNEDATAVLVVKSHGLVGEPGNVAGSHAEIAVAFVAPQGHTDELRTVEAGTAGASGVAAFKVVAARRGDAGDHVVRATATGTGANATFSRLVAAPAAGRLVGVKMVSDLATTGSDGSNKWDITVTDGAGNDTGITKTTHGSELVANAVIDLVTLSTNLDFAKGELLKLTVTKDGSPTDLSSANISAVFDLRTAEIVLCGQAPVDGKLVGVRLVVGATTSGSDGGNKWVVTVTDGAGNDTGIAYSTAEDEFVAHGVVDLSGGLSSNLSFAAGEMFKVVLTRTGLPTDLATADISVELDFRPATIVQVAQAPVAGKLVGVRLVVGATTSGSDGGNKWVVTVTDGAGNDTGIAYSTAEDEFVANFVEDLTSGLSANLIFEKGEAVKGILTRTGLPTDLAAADVTFQFDFKQS